MKLFRVGTHALNVEQLIAAQRVPGKSPKSAGSISLWFGAGKSLVLKFGTEEERAAAWESIRKRLGATAFAQSDSLAWRQEATCYAAIEVDADGKPSGGTLVLRVGPADELKTPLDAGAAAVVSKLAGPLERRQGEVILGGQPPLSGS